MDIYIICASPRSGTTWLHNILVKSSFFKGKLAKDTDFVRIKKGEILTDEDPLITKYATIAMFDKNLIIRQYCFKLLKKRILKLKDLFATENGLILESPYYSFFLPLFKQIFDDNLKIIHIKREPVNVAFSMSNHPHLKNILSKRYDKSFDLYVGFLKRYSVEEKFAHKKVRDFVLSNYNNLSIIERGLYKWHYFNRSFYLFIRDECGTVLDINYEDINNKYLDRIQINNFFNGINIKTIISDSYENLNKNIDVNAVLTSKGIELYELINQYTFD